MKEQTNQCRICGETLRDTESGIWRCCGVFQSTRPQTPAREYQVACVDCGRPVTVREGDEPRNPMAFWPLCGMCPD